MISYDKEHPRPTPAAYTFCGKVENSAQPGSYLGLAAYYPWDSGKSRGPCELCWLTSETAIVIPVPCFSRRVAVGRKR